jgi:hypothetical protein
MTEVRGQRADGIEHGAESRECGIWKVEYLISDFEF